MKKKERLFNKTVKPMLTGKFFSTSNGGVFFEQKGDVLLKENKYFVEAEDCGGALNGDTVRVKLLNRRSDVRVTEIIEREIETLVGVYRTESGDKGYVRADSSKLRFDVLIKENRSNKEPSNGDKVAVKLIRYPRYVGDEAVGIVTEVFGDSRMRAANYNAVLYEKGIITEFPEEAELEAELCGKDIPLADNRVDLRNEIIFTIDGEDAKDLDDAISVRKNGSDYVLGVHIADVSHYVKEGSALDKSAIERGTSVYFSDKVVPMLPVALSNGICSLNSGVDRYTLSVIIDIDKFGEIKCARPCKAIINSKVRGVYSEVNALISGEADDNLKAKYASVLNGTLDNAVELYGVLKKKSVRRGALDLDSAEAKIVLDSHGEPCDIIKRSRGIAEMIIEQFMLCANEAVAEYLTNKNIPCVYRIHEKPDNEKVMSFVRFAHNLKLSPPYLKKDNVSAGYFGGILDKARENGVGFAVSQMLLRSMQKAKYSENNCGHFGLASSCYCHFTSPIRRYPDLAVHRILTVALTENSSAVSKKYSAYAKMAAKKSSETELRALEAERAIDDLYKTIYMSKKIGEVCDAVVSSVTPFGLFCMLDNTCEGLIPISKIDGHIYYDRENITLSVNGRIYHIGDCLKIRVEVADISTQRVDFSFADATV